MLDHARAGPAAIEMHFEALDYFNSSTVTVLIQFLKQARAQRVRLSFVYQPKVRWQKLSFDALRVFEQGDGLVHVIELA